MRARGVGRRSRVDWGLEDDRRTRVGRDLGLAAGTQSGPRPVRLLDRTDAVGKVAAPVAQRIARTGHGHTDLMPSVVIRETVRAVGNGVVLPVVVHDIIHGLWDPLVVLNV